MSEGFGQKNRGNERGRRRTRTREEISLVFRVTGLTENRGGVNSNDGDYDEVMKRFSSIPSTKKQY